MCFHWSNLQPLWEEENLSKSDSFDNETFNYRWVNRDVGWFIKQAIL